MKISSKTVDPKHIEPIRCFACNDSPHIMYFVYVDKVPTDVYVEFLNSKNKLTNFIAYHNFYNSEVRDDVTGETFTSGHTFFVCDKCHERLLKR